MSNEETQQGINSIRLVLTNENINISDSEIEKHLSKILEERITHLLKNQSAVFTLAKLQNVTKAFSGEQQVERQREQNRKSRKLTS